MKKKSGGGEGGGANWMDTYGDMVTLLLCFFVLLYSISTVDESKWKDMVQSFNPNATPAETEIEAGDNDGPFWEDNDDNPGITDPADAESIAKEQEEVDNAMEQLYEMMKQYIDGSGKNIEITKGDNGVYLSFQNAVFFDGDSWEIRDDGKLVLDALAPIIEKTKEYIDEIRILGHTAQANDEHANDAEFDWELACMRAARVTAYLQTHITLNPGRLQGAGFGQHRPVAPNDVEENMKKNRRVEMIITGKDLMNQLGDSLEQYETMRTEGPKKASAASDSSAAPQGTSGPNATAGPEESGSSSQEG